MGKSFQRLIVGFSIVVWQCLPANATAVATAPQAFTYQGFFTIDNSGTPLIDTNVNVIIKIYDPSGTCLLYQEQQNHLDFSQTGGYFALQVGSSVNSPKRVSGIDPGLAMNDVFANPAGLNAITLGGGASCPNGYTPQSNDVRLLRLTINAPSIGHPVILVPDEIINSVPNTLVADSLQGLGPSQLLQIGQNGSALNQNNVEQLFSPQNFNTLLQLVNGTSSQYVVQTANGILLPSLAAAPSSPQQGQIWFNNQTQTLQFFDGTGISSLGIYASPGTVTSISAGFGLTGGTITTTGTLALAPSGVTAGLYGNGNTIPVLTIDATGRILNANATPLSLPLTGVTAGTYGSSNSVPSFTVDATGRVTQIQSSSINVTNTSSGISSVQAVANALVLRDPNGASNFTGVGIQPLNSNYLITLATPNNLNNTYNLTFPNGPGQYGQTFVTDGNGGLIWGTSVLSIGAISPLQVTNGNNPILSIGVASSNSNGYLSSSDWNTFNSKIGGSANLTTPGSLLMTASGGGTISQVPGISGSTNPLISQLSIKAGAAQGTTPLTRWADANNANLYTINSSGTPTIATDLTTLSYVSSLIATNNGSYLPLSGGTMHGSISFNNTNTIQNLAVPINSNDAATKSYVDTMGQAAGGDLSGFYPNPNVIALNGYSIAATAPTAGSFLKYSSNAYTPSFLNINDILSQNGSNVFFPLTCNSSQTYVYNSTTDTMNCVTVSLSGGTGVVAVANGGTGNSSLAANLLLLGNGNSPLNSVAAAPAGWVLSANGLTNPPQFGQIDLTGNTITNILPINHGGTGVSTLPSNQLVVGNGSAALGSISNAAAGSTLVASGSGAPSFQALNLNNSNAITGTLNVSNGGTGLSALTANALLLGNGSGSLSSVTPASSGLFLRANGSVSAPSFATINLANTASFANKLPIVLGGTNAINFTDSQLLLGASGSNAMTQVTNGAQGTVLMSGATVAAAPSFGTINLASSNSLSGILPVTAGGTGTVSLNTNQLLVGSGTAAIASLGSGLTNAPLISGGSNLPSFTTLSLTNSNAISGILGITNGGTGASSFTTNTLILGGGTLSSLANGTTSGLLLASQGSGNAPIYTALDFNNANMFTNTLGVNNGGTGVTTLPVNQVVLGNATLPLTTVPSGNNGAVLISGGLGVAPTFAALNLANSNAVGSSILGTGNGGTSVSSLSANQLLMGGGGGPITTLTAGAAGTVLLSNGGSPPAFATINLSTGSGLNYSGILPISNGGTGAGTLAANQLLIGSGSSALAAIASGTINQVLLSNGSSAPAFAALSLTNSNSITGTLTVANGGTGQTTTTTAFNALSPLTTLGDMLYFDGTNNLRLAGSTSSNPAVLTQTGTGSVSAAPLWSTTPTFNGSNITNLNLSNFSTASGAINLIAGGTNSNITLTPTGTGGVIIGGGIGLNMNSTSIFNQITPISIKTAAYSLVITDSGSIIGMNVSDANNLVYLTLPNNLPTGFNIAVSQDGNDLVTFLPATGANLINRQGYTSTAGQYAIVSLFVHDNSSGTNATWLLSGDTSP